MTSNTKKELDQSLYKGLQAISDLSFPKECGTCGKRFETVEDFISQTESVRKTSGFKEEQDDSNIIVELYRNCTCGSTLMDEFNNRRILSLAGMKRRDKFEELLDRLVQEGIPPESARKELLNIMRGKGSKLLNVRASGKD